MATLEAGVSLVAREDVNWRKDLISQLRERNRSQTNCFADLISLHNRLFESANTLRGANMQLTIANETLRREVASGSIGVGGNPDLEARLLKQAEELAMLHKRKGEHTQQIVDLNNKLQEMTKEFHTKDVSLAESLEVNANLRIEITKYLGREKELEGVNQMLKDEHQALQLAFASLEEKLRKTQEENRQLIERLIKYKARDAEKMNEENDNFLRKRQAKMQKELEDAARDTRPVSPDRSSLTEGIAGLPTAVPTNVSVTFSAHDGEVYAVKWSPTDRILLATGGADRKVKLWNIAAKGTSESKGILVGSNAGVMSVDFDSTGTLILGASNDYASRVWTVSDLRLKVSTSRTTWRLLLVCSVVLLLGLLQHTEGARKRFRRPTTSAPSISNDQEVSASVNRFKVTRNRVSNKSSKNELQPGKTNDYKLVCYYTNWSQYRTKIGKFLPEDIQPDLCTHVIFAFGWLKKNKLTSFESNDETKDGKTGLYERVVNLKKANPSLKVLLAIGGWSFGTQKFKDLSSTRYARQTFIYSAIPYLRDRNFDGLDIDWEYPKGGDDKKNYVLLLKELREAFEAEAKERKKPRLLLTAAVPVGPDNVKSGYDVPAVASYMDFINLMAYDFHGKWERETGHNAPLYASSLDSEWQKQLSVDNAATMWVKLGAPKEKLIIGMPTYGRSFTLSNPANFRVHSPANGGGKAGEYTKESGFLAYYEICEMLHNGAAYVWDDEMKVPYLVYNDQWVGFDDEKSIRNKMHWLKSKGYGGAMVWTVDMDDFNGTVCGGNVRYPLVGAMREELRGISRGTNAKDVDWSAVATTITETIVKKPESYKISVSEVLNKSKKLQKSTQLVINTPIQEREAQTICYLTNWSHKRPGMGRFSPEDIDPTLCTHVVYAFATLKDHLLTEGSDKDAEMYNRLIALRDKNPDIKILLAIGGWAFGSTPFKELTSNTFRMNQFVYEAIDFLREYKFDGLDVDWEYPRGADDRSAYVNLLKELRLAFEGEAKSSAQPKLILSAAVPASFEAIAAGYDVPEISKYLDFINVMAYDFHGQWERQVGHNSPLYPLESATSYQKKLTVDYSAREWVKQGAPKEKLMIGMPTYGRSFTLVDKEKFDIGAPASGGGVAGNFTNESGFLSYYEVCSFLNEDNTTLVWDSEQQVPFAYRDDQWVGFDDERSLINKMSWLKEEGFGGVMIWSVDMDDFKGSCGAGRYPLIKAMKKELQGYKVKLEYDGPYESTARNGKYTTKDPNEVMCDEEDNHISYHADKNDCTMYYMCEGERKHHMPCPVNLVFNPNENVCDWPENVEGCLQHTQAPPV